MLLNGIGCGERRVLGIKVQEGPIVGLLVESSAIVKLVSGILSENHLQSSSAILGRGTMI